MKAVSITKKALMAICIIFSLSLTTVETYATTYDTYIYSFWGRAIPSTAAYTPSRVLGGMDLGLDAFVELSDIAVRDEKIFLVDAGTNSVIILDNQWQVLKVIKEFGKDKEDSFNKPQGIFISKKNVIYVADSGNERIVRFDENYELIDVITKPETSFLENLPFVPTKIAVDKADRIYVIAKGIYEGIIELDAGGEFSRFTGVNKVAINPVDYFWKVIGTKKQKEQMALYIPTEFENIDIDPSGFLYTISLPNKEELKKVAEDPIKRINPKGEDVLRREGYIWVIGDINVGTENMSSFIDVVVDDSGRYSALDATRGRIFTYDDDGNLLYIFGGLGNQMGTFTRPVALAYHGQEIMVVDGTSNTITVFEPTEFGLSINEATRHQYVGNYEEAASYWKRVNELDTNYDLAYVGIGKALYRDKNYKDACYYFKLGNQKDYYGKAYQKYRKEVLRRWFGPVMTVVVLGILLWFIWRIFRRRGRKQC